MHTISNWNESVSFTVTDGNIKSPANVSEIQATVKDAAAKNLPIKVYGATHSTTACFEGSGISISLRKMAKILSIDKEKLTVTVQAGVTLHELVNHLKPLGLQPPVILEMGPYHIGAISGTHANDTSVTRGTQFSSYCVGYKLVTPSGDLLEVSETQNAEYLPALRSHFGLFGVVYEVTVRILKSQPLRINYEITHIDPFKANFAKNVHALRTSYDQVFGMLFPDSGTLLWQCRKFLDPSAPKPGPIEKLIDKVESKGINIYKDFLLPLVKAGTELHPARPLAELLNKSLIEVPIRLMAHSVYTIDPGDRAITWDEGNPPFEFYDWVFPEEKWVEMVQAFLKLAGRFRDEHDFTFPIPTLIYYINKDEASLLSRSRGGNMITVDPQYTDPNDATWKKFRLAFNEIAILHGGIPHINKTRDGAINHFAKQQDQTSVKKYLELRKKIDPNGLFLNDYFRTLYKGYL